MPTSSPQTPAPAGENAENIASHQQPDLATEATTQAALFFELRELTAAVRSHLGWLKDAGVEGLPMPRPRPKPEPAVAPAPARSVDREYAPPASANRRELAPPPMDHAPAAEHIRPEDDAAAAALAALAASARAAGSSGPRSRSAPIAAPLPSPRPSLFPTAPVEYPELAAAAQAPDGQALVSIRSVVGDCRRCKLCHGRNNIVFGEGSATPWLAFVGEGPGADEDRTGLPFVGAAGELLTKMIKGMSDLASKQGQRELAAMLTRQSVYICNVVKCRPPGNRTPEPDEIQSCSPFLRAQLQSLRPHLKVIVALGRTPTHYLLNTTAPISKLRGQFADWNGIPLMPTFHPAYLLRTPSAKVQAWEDLKQVLGLMGQLSTATQPAPAPM